MTVEQLEQNHAAAEAVVKELEREIRQEIAAATKAINEKWAERLNAANAARYEARKAADEALMAKGAEHPLHGKRVSKIERKYTGNGWHRKGEDVEVFGIVEVFTPQTERPANQSYGLPSYGTPIVRLLKKNGAPGSKFERLCSWNGTEQWKLAE